VAEGRDLVTNRAGRGRSGNGGGLRPAMNDDMEAGGNQSMGKGSWRMTAGREEHAAVAGWKVARRRQRLDGRWWR
jgi:hypothetical protein